MKEAKVFKQGTLFRLKRGKLLHRHLEVSARRQLRSNLPRREKMDVVACDEIVRLAHSEQFSLRPLPIVAAPCASKPQRFTLFAKRRRHFVLYSDGE